MQTSVGSLDYGSRRAELGKACGKVHLNIKTPRILSQNPGRLPFLTFLESRGKSREVNGLKPEKNLDTF